MARIFITGSTDGLGQLSAKSLIEKGHKVVLHARNAERARDAIKMNPGAESVLTAELSNLEETKNLAREINKLEAFGAVIHNAAVYEATGEEIFAVNTLATYVLTCLVKKTKRLIYLSSGMHLYGHLKLDHFKTGRSHITYSD